MKYLKQSKVNFVIHIFLCLLFFVFALLQLNDPDPYVWFPIYFMISVFCLLINFIHLPKFLLWVSIVGLSMYATTYFTYLVDWLHTNHKEEIFGKMVYQKPYLEGSREFIGLLMGIGAMLFLVKNVKNK